MPRQRLFYELHLSKELHRDKKKRAVVSDWLKANGLDPNRIAVGVTVRVWRRDDDSLWLRTRQVLEGYPLCEHCDECFKQEPVEVPLLTDLPAIEAARMPLLRGADTDKEANRG